MSKTRLYVNKKLSENLIIHIKNKQHHFLKNVLRIKLQDLVMVFDGCSGEWFSKVISINRDNIVLQVSNKSKNLEEEKDIWLIYAPIKNSRMSITIQKATELGVTRFIPCHTEYTNMPKINLKNLKLNIIESSEQSERLTIPSFNEPIKLTDIIEKFPLDRGLIFCDEQKIGNPNIYNALSENIKKYKKWAVIIGPEGGFSTEERIKIKSISSTISVSLGRTTLRSDTATTAALFCVQSLLDL